MFAALVLVFGGAAEELLPKVLAAGRVREMTLKEQNVDELIARMYKEMAL